MNKKPIIESNLHLKIKSYRARLSTLLACLCLVGCSDSPPMNQAGVKVEEPGMAESQKVSAIPDFFQGKWATSEEHCKNQFAMSIVKIKPREYLAREGGGDVKSIEGSDDRTKVTVMFASEGAEEVEYVPTVFELVRTGENKMKLIEHWRTRDMVRCNS